MTRPYEVVKVGQPRSPEWYAARRRAIGSSEAASVLGFGRWAHPLGVWLDKTQDVDPGEYDHRTGQAFSSGQRQALDAGHAFEEVIARVWADQAGEHIARPPALLRSRRYPWMQASLDWAVVAGPRARAPLAPVECKLVSHGWDDWRNTDGDLAVPDYYVVQVWHQLVVLDQPVGHVAAFLGGKVEPFTVEADDALRAEVAERERQWWERHVVHGERPPLEPVPDRALLDRAVPRPLRERRDVTGSPLAAALLVRREAAGEAEAAAKVRKQRATDELCALLDDADALVWDGQVVATWRPDKNGRRSFIPKPLPPSLLDAATPRADAA